MRQPYKRSIRSLSFILCLSTCYQMAEKALPENVCCVVAHHQKVNLPLMDCGRMPVSPPWAKVDVQVGRWWGTLAQNLPMLSVYNFLFDLNLILNFVGSTIRCPSVHRKVSLEL